MRDEMTKRERIEAALKGEEVDRTPVSVWMHFPQQDRSARGLVDALLAFQRKYDWDFMKVMFRSSFAVEDWGCKFDGYNIPIGNWKQTSYVIEGADDWTKLEPLDPYKGTLGEMVGALRLIEAELEEDMFKVATVFCPVMVASKLVGDRFFQVLKENSTLLHQGMEVITKTVTDFALACLENGADGIFFATQSASYDLMTQEEYGHLGRKYDLQVLKVIADVSRFTILHICGKNIMFDYLSDYPVHAINWDDRNTSPSLREARSRYSGGLIGGLDRWGVIRTGTPTQVMAEAREAIEGCGGRGLIVAPGCGLPMDVPEENLIALRGAVENSLEV